MLCCALAVLAIGPLGFITRRWSLRGQGRECCAGRQRVMAGAVVALTMAAILGWAFFFPVPFRHICRFPAVAATRL